MECVLVGTKNVDYVSKKTGQPVKGVSLYIERDPTERETDVSGLVTDSIFISSSSACFKSLPTLTPGCSYDLLYDFDGRYSFLSGVVPLE